MTVFEKSKNQEEVLGGIVLALADELVGDDVFGGVAEEEEEEVVVLDRALVLLLLLLLVDATSAATELLPLLVDGDGVADDDAVQRLLL